MLDALNVGYEQLRLNAVEYPPDSPSRPKPPLNIRVTGPQRVVNLRLIAPATMAMNEQLVLGTVGVINTIYKQAGIRFVLKGGQIERMEGVSQTFSAKNIDHLRTRQDINRQTTCATIFFATDIYNNDDISIPGVAVSHHSIVGGTIGAVQEKLAYAVVRIRPAPITGAIGETMAHELGHVIATLGDSSNKSCLMYQVGRDADNLNAAEVYWLRHPPVGGVDNPPPANKSRFFAN